MSFLKNLVNKLPTHSSRYRILQRSLSSENQPPLENAQEKQGGFAQAYEKFEAIAEAPKPETFASLLRNSKFIDMGDPAGKVVQGKIFHIVEDDLYIDFGWKFHCVCPRPKKQASSYIRGAKVRLRVRDLELSSKFLGYDKDLTLLEADCFLIGLIQDRSNVNS